MVRVYGNWCGPDWTAGRSKAARALTNDELNFPAIDETDQTCKDHDIALAHATTDEEVQKANADFYNANYGKSFFRTAMAVAVKNFGPQTMADTMAPSNPKLRTEWPKDVPDDGEEHKESENTPTPSVSDETPFMTPTKTKRPAEPMTRSEDGKRIKGKTIERESLFNLPSEAEMSEPAAESRALATSEGAGATGVGTSRKETPVLPLYNSLPFRDVTQTRFKNQYFFSVNDLAWTSGTQEPTLGLSTNRFLKIRMNDYRYAWSGPYQPQVAGTNVSSGISTNAMCGRYRIDSGAGYPWKNPGTLVPFPETNLTPWNYMPQMHKYYTNLYNAMSVVKVEWKLHIDFPSPEFPEVEENGEVVPQTVATNSAHTLSVPVVSTIPQASVNSSFTVPLEGRDNTVVKYDNTAYSGVPYATRQLQSAHDITEAQSTSTTPGYTTVIRDPRPDFSPRPYGARIAVNYNTYGTQDTESNMPVPCHIMDMERWPAITDRKTIYNADRGNNGSSHHVISGTWTPNWQNHNPLNEADIKTWLSTFDSNYNYQEFLMIQFFRTWDTPKLPAEKIGLNCWLEVNYDVQFRGLKQAAMWPLQNKAYSYPAVQPSVILNMPESSYYINSGDDPVETIPTREP